MRKLWFAGMVIILVMVGPAQGAMDAAGQTVITHSGQGSSSLRPFTVHDEWEIQWSAKGTAFGIVLNPVHIEGLAEEGAQLPDLTKMIKSTMAMQAKVIAFSAGAGSHYVPKGGKYYLEIIAMGPWTITIVEIQ